MYKYLLDYTLLLAFIAFASAGLFLATSSFAVQSAGARPTSEMLPFDCSIPPEISPASLPCQP